MVKEKVAKLIAGTEKFCDANVHQLGLLDALGAYISKNTTKQFRQTVKNATSDEAEIIRLAAAFGIALWIARMESSR